MDAIFFDLDDTLYDQARPFAYAVRTVVGELPGVSVAELYEARQRHSKAIFDAFLVPRRPTDEEYVARMQGTLAEFGVDVSRETALEAQRVYASQPAAGMSLTPVMEGILERCHARVRMGVITNGRERLQLDKLRVLGLDRWFAPENVFISNALGLAKPDRAIFEYACAQMGADPLGCVHVGDSYGIDVVGAYGAGMRSVWFNHRLRERPEGGPDPTWTVTSERELSELLKDLLGACAPRLA